jgi:hypothetical protein
MLSFSISAYPPQQKNPRCIARCEQPAQGDASDLGGCRRNQRNHGHVVTMEISPKIRVKVSRAKWPSSQSRGHGGASGKSPGTTDKK